MAFALVDLVGSDVRFSGEGIAETRQAAAQAVSLLRVWSKRYDNATAGADEDELLKIGREMFDWLARQGLGPAWVKGAGDLELVISIDRQDDPLTEAALLDAPWELLATDRAWLAEDAMRPFVISRRVAQGGAPREAAYCDLRLMFMAASPDGQVELDYEAEEMAILKAKKDSDGVQLVVEETGCLDFLSKRLASNEGPFEALHLSCHGKIDHHRGPVLLLETAEGGAKPVTPGELFSALTKHGLPSLVALSACRTAELGQQGRGGDEGLRAVLTSDALRGDAGTAHFADGGEFTASFARKLATQVANVLAWDGRVFDQDATSFAKTFYTRLGLGEPAPRAAALARQALLGDKASDPSKGRHWHLARVYLGPGGGGPLCSRDKDIWHPRLPDSYETVFLDQKRNRVPVTPRSAFVGRRRSIQAVLRAFRDCHGLAAAVLVHGMGALGKSSLVARVASRAEGREPLVIFESYDALAVFDAVLDAVPEETQMTVRDKWRWQVEQDQDILALALRDLLEKQFDDKPILLIVDDLERILDSPRPGNRLMEVQESHRKALGSILRAFDRAQTDSRLILTSRFDFQLPDGQGGDLAVGLTRVQLVPMPDREQLKQLRRAVAGGEALRLDERAWSLLARAVQAAGGNPGLQAALTKPVLQGYHDAAETALGQIEHFRQTGAPPVEIQALFDAGTAKDSDNAMVAFFVRLAFMTYRDALTINEARQLSAVVLFTAGIPIPWAALQAAGTALGVKDAAAAMARLVALGLLDDHGTIRGHPHAAANPLARPLAVALDEADLRSLARAALSELDRAWTDFDGIISTDPRAVVVAQLRSLAAL